ncbi:MAG: DEAD/DEAH box helicase family protein [Actinomycetota bacterium]
MTSPESTLSRTGPRRPAAKQQSVILRAWQQQALRAFTAHNGDSFLTVACPGAGKTSFALVAARQWCAGERRPFVVVVPTQHLKAQWAASALRFGFHLDPAWSATDGPPAPDMHGVVVTYAQAASSSGPLATYIRDGLVILDEIHHAASERSWGTGVEDAFGGAACRLLLSGTPFRTDDSPIPFVRYSWGDYGDAVADFEYGYGEALVDGGVVRPVYFPRFDGHMEWMNADGDVVEASFSDELIGNEWSARLRTALSPDGNWIRTVIDRAHAKLGEIRETHPNAGGLVIATDHEHARAIVDLLKMRHRVDARVALSDDPRAGQVIADYVDSDDEWVVAVRMISEGVDIPRLRVGVFATTTTTAMFFRQAVGRIARWTAGVPKQKAYMYLPDDPRLRHHASAIAEQRRHSIEIRQQRVADEGFDPIAQERDEEQMSLFAALSSTATDAVVPDDGLDRDETMVVLPDDLEGFAVDLPPPPPLPGRDIDVTDDPWASGAPSTGDEPAKSRAQIKADLRDQNSDRVREIVARTGMGYPEVNSRLNRESGVERINEATISGLTRRLSAADRWIASLRGRG